MYRRKPAVAGAFYPSNPQRLGGMIDGYMQEARSAPPAGDVVGVVSPHAGYIYSGRSRPILSPSLIRQRLLR